MGSERRGRTNGAERHGRTTRPSPLLPGEVKIVLDKELMGAARIGCHPLSNAATCVLTPDQLTQFLARTKHEPVIVDFEGAVVTLATLTLPLKPNPNPEP